MAESVNVPIVACILYFTGFMLFFASVYYYLHYRRDRSRMFSKIKLAGAPGDMGAAAADSTSGGAATTPIINLLGAVGDRMMPEDTKDIKRRRLDFLRAGVRTKNAVAVFWGAKCLIALSFALVFLNLKPIFFQHLKPYPTLLISAILAALGFYLPDTWLKLRVSRRKRTIQDGLPDALDLLVVCVEAGVSLDAAINRVGEEIRMDNKALSEEIQLLDMEVRAGKLRRDALKSLALRTDLDDIRSLVALLGQTEKFGTSVAQALRVYSDSFRTARMQRAEEIAAKLPVKMLIPLALFILPAIFVVILGPACIQIFRVLIHK